MHFCYRLLPQSLCVLEFRPTRDSLFIAGAFSLSISLECNQNENMSFKQIFPHSLEPVREDKDYLSFHRILSCGPNSVEGNQKGIWGCTLACYSGSMDQSSFTINFRFQTGICIDGVLSSKFPHTALSNCSEYEMPGLESWKSNLHSLPPLHPLQKKNSSLSLREHGPISKIPSLGMLEKAFLFSPLLV